MARGEEQAERKQVWLTEQQLEVIAQRAAEHAINKVYNEVGRQTVRAALWVIGAAVVGLFAYLGITGKLPK